MEIHYTNRNRLPPELERDAVFHATVQSLFETVDMISQLSGNTGNGEFGERAIDRLDEAGCCIRQYCSGRLVDESALIEALSSRHIAAAGLDVYQTEPGGNPAFAACPNVLMLPHLGSSTRETRKAMGDRALDNLDAFLLDVNHEIDWFSGLRNLV